MKVKCLRGTSRIKQEKFKKRRQDWNKHFYFLCLFLAILATLHLANVFLVRFSIENKRHTLAVFRRDIINR